MTILKEVKARPHYLKFGMDRISRYDIDLDYVSRLVLIEQILFKHLEEVDADFFSEIATNLINLIDTWYVDPMLKHDKYYRVTLRQDVLKVLADIKAHFFIKDEEEDERRRQYREAILQP